jgi:hypothetical protein
MKYVLEAILGIASLALGANFWSIWKSPRFFKGLLADPEKFVAAFGPDRLRSEGVNIEPVLGSYYKNILSWQEASRTALRSARNLFLVLTLVVFAVSYFLGLGFLAVNAALFLLIGVAPISDAAKNNMANDFATVLLNVYKWNLETPDECLVLIASDAPWLSETLLAVKRIA